MTLQYRLNEIEQAAEQCWKAIGDRKVIAVHGPMGAGKTTLIHALCDQKGIKDPVTSPTFSLVNEYQYDCEGTRRVLFHMDLYRVRSEEEAMQAGIQDCLYSGNTCLVEWPEKAPGIFPPGTINLYIDIINTDTRKLRIDDN
jgi:tRNA threonylcarbamoyladenosine biosynthesis protein TsaE